MKTYWILILTFCLSLLPLAAADSFIVENGKAKAEIVIAKDPPRSTHLAAQELQTYVEKITGAKLEIVSEVGSGMAVKLYVGQSPYTDQLGITSKGLEKGAYRIVSGDQWMVFIGDDSNFVPIEPWPRSNNDIASGKMQQAWNKITGKQWGYMHGQLHKHYSGSRSLFGTDKEQKLDKNGKVNMWTYDERGSFNAVDGFLRDMGVRWYMPGDIGEVLPQMKSISLPQVDKIVTPDFPMRILNFRAGLYGRDAMMWGFRLGTRQPYGRQAAHGLHGMTDNEATFKNHPEWFALYGGKRHIDPNLRNNQLCYSNEELLQEAVLFARTQLDHFDMDVVSIMPPDGYSAICQCKLCEGKESPQLGSRGKASNYVWDFVNRVAKEVGKTHPNKRISNCAYGIYTNPPDNIKKLEPNVQVIIVGGRRPTAESREELRQLRAGWAKLTDRPIEIFENYPFTGRGFYLPAYIPKVMGESINETKGASRGEDIWITMDFKENAIGYNHFLLYFTGRMYWGGKEQDALAMFDEYCQLFYGPAGDDMRAFFSYCEDNWREMESDGDKASRALELFAKAKDGVAGDSIYGQRIALIDNFLNSLRDKSKQLSQKRGPVPRLRLVSQPRGEIVIDGKLDDFLWEKCSLAATGNFRELQTARQPVYGTSIKVAWVGNNLYFAIRCEERPGEKLNVATTKNGDQAIWYGDALEILLETESHSYYQIAVNPSGALIDIDRGANRNNWFNWSSQAEVATQVADDHWTVEIRIPVTQDKNDPLHQVIGRKPTKSLPWFINLCRQRIRESGSEYSAFSPTGTKGFHEKMKFAHFYAGLSYQFPADDSVTDYLIAGKAAADLMRARKSKEAMEAYVAMAAGKGISDFQKSDALQFAALAAQRLKEYERAEQLAGQIPLESVAKTVRMENLLAQRKWQDLVEQFGSEDIGEWPFWQRGAGAFARGRAYAITKAGEKAESDLKMALQYTPDRRIRSSILATMGSNRETNLKDDKAALEAYRQNFESKKQIGAAEEFRSVQNAARILMRQGDLDEALQTIGRVDIEKLKGVWSQSSRMVRAEILTKAGREKEALADYRVVMADKNARAALRKVAEGAVKTLEAR
ncbi:MAG: DUF4838 domain-containing protein [Verrucomicrobiota bacterium]